MKITKRKLRKLIKEEMHDCIKDYMRTHGYSRDRAGKECGEEESSRYSGYSRPRYRRKTSYVGASANAEQIEAVEAYLATKPSNFLNSVLKQLKMGRGLSSKQKSIVKRMLGKKDPGAAALFESTIEQKLRSFIRETIDFQIFS
tara:strand:- start:417 stop:848 length:432 start_codon:yes stop_codon:yes gene_type:complete